MPWVGQIKDALFYAAMHCDLESESDKLMEYLHRVIEKLRPRRDVLWSYSCFELRKKGRSRKEISEKTHGSHTDFVPLQLNMLKHKVLAV